MTEVFATPDEHARQGTNLDIQTSWGATLSANIGEGLFPVVRQLSRIGEYAGAAGMPPDPGTMGGYMPPGYAWAPADIPDVPIADAKVRVKQEGLEGKFKLPDQPTIKQPVLDLMIQHQHEQDRYNAAVSRGPTGSGALGWVTQLGLGIIDPVNIAAFSIPVLGEALPARLVAGAGESMLGRAAVGAGIGSVQGAVGTAALQPAEWWLHTRDGHDYTMAEALHSIVLGAGMGAGFHAGFGALGDVMARRAGQPLHGTVLDLQTRALGGDTHAAALLERMGGSRMTPENAPAVEPGRPPVDAAPAGEEVPGIAPGESAQPARAGEGAPPVTEGAARDLEFAPLPKLEDLPPDHPAHVLEDLPPAVREDVTRAAMADVINGNAVRGAELLQEAAKAEPRIAESLGPRLAEVSSEGDRHRFSIVDPAGRETGSLALTERDGGKELFVNFVGNSSDGGAFGEIGSLGPRAVRMLQSQLRERFPEAERISGYRSTGGRADEQLVTLSLREPLRGEQLLGSTPDSFVTVPASRGPRARPEETWSLNEFLAHRGGLDPNDPMIGDVRHAIGAGNKFVPGFGHLIRKGGMRLDQAREAAVEAGYLFDVGEHTGREAKTNINTLLEAVDRELRGERVYRAGHEPEKPANREAQRHSLEREILGTLGDDGINSGAVTAARLARMVEMIEREGVRDPLAAWERALMEETERGVETGEHGRIAEPIPGWDVPHDAGAASPAGRPDARGEAGPGAGARAPGGGDRAAPSGKPDWQRVADAKRADDADLAEVSRQAEKAPEPESASPEPAKVVSAAERAAGEADQLLADLLPKLSEEERARFTEVLEALETDKAQREQIVREGAECLLAAIA